jgi:Fcf2 pre-rRNA processing
VKQDLRMLALRGALDPKRFYRNPDATKFPKYFQMGTVVGGPTDFYTGAHNVDDIRCTASVLYFL